MPVSRRSQGRNIPSLFAILLAAYACTVDAQDDCKIQYGGVDYDLSPLAGPHWVTRDRSTPPTKMKDTIDFAICGGELPIKGDIAQGDQVRGHLAMLGRAGSDRRVRSAARGRWGA